MWQQIRTAFTLFIAVSLVAGVLYPLLTTGLAQVFFHRQANGSILNINDKKIASELIGQPFHDTRYFWGRPSATAPVTYNSSSSAGSNLGPMNPDLLVAVRKRVTALQAADPANRLPIPVDLVTASGSGLDPHISPAAAFYQVPRIARVRGIDERIIAALVRDHIRDRTLGIFGEPTVSVLQLNMALDAMR